MSRKIIIMFFLLLGVHTSASDIVFEDKFLRDSLELVAFHVNEDTMYEIAILGNSITYHPPARGIGWSHSHGMSATVESKDYAHQLLRLLQLDSSKAYIRNIYPLEIDSKPIKKFQKEFVTDLSNIDTLVVFMGDNTTHGGNLKMFSKSYRGVLNSFGKDVSLICVSTFWNIKSTDALIESMCKEYLGVYVDIGYVYLIQLRRHQVMKLLGFDFDFDNGGLVAHPDNLSMLLIAISIFFAI